MIVPMKKVSLVLLESERRSALKKLRRLGVVHVERLAGNSAELHAAAGVYDDFEAAYMLVSELKNSSAKNTVQETDLSYEDALEKARGFLALAERKKSCAEQIAAYRSELQRFAAWGDADPADFAYLCEHGIALSLFEIPADRYADIPETIQTLVVNRDKTSVRFLCIGAASDAGKRPDGLPAEAYAVALPSVPTAELQRRIEALEAEIASIDAETAQGVRYKSLFERCCRQTAKDVEFENIYAGMGHEEDGETKLAWLSGFVPADDMPALSAAAKREGWALLSCEPADDDEVPTKLRNNKFVSLIYPVSDFLGTVPGYREYDISGWFLLFFCVFFGMIFGDGGYGLLLTFVAVGAIVASLSKKKRPEPVMNLLLLLGLCTVAWGLVTCTWFGLSPEQLPGWLKALSVRPLSNAVSAESPEMETWVKQNVQVFCFALALIQLSIAHIKGIARYIKSARFLGELGSLLMVWGMFNVVLSLVVDGTRFPISTASITLIAVGFVLSFVFANYDGSLGQSILESCKNIVSVLLGVVNVFSDIVSYIRLWAVGLAGSAISATVNSMAGPTLGGALIFLGILLLVFGHGLNMILNVLSVIVHGVRLNTLEFSNHLGMSWSGFAYEPFSETVKK